MYNDITVPKIAHHVKDKASRTFWGARHAERFGALSSTDADTLLSKYNPQTIDEAWLLARKPHL
jgi:hypothetical protein